MPKILFGSFERKLATRGPSLSRPVLAFAFWSCPACVGAAYFNGTIRIAAHHNRAVIKSESAGEANIDTKLGGYFNKVITTRLHVVR